MTATSPVEITAQADIDVCDWLVWSNKWGAWHRPDFCGYTQDISRAGRFTRTRAMRYHDSDPKLRKHGNEARHVSTVRSTIEAAIQAKIDECAGAVERLRSHLATLPDAAALAQEATNV